ncbi:class I SAM-dependent methyltransferase [Bradyrhizobium septentrionale]|uniref:Class I SAM-dependent methyltransferase n=1 Tax=Bradyrhizobium septentrionale TaxID=1404411 RepID=A0A974A4J0_9BRAD|nr:methyltransferase domain-containing protein [Bradyrhizobium septentrionale]UGY16069.1 methyltransferase domain-containing protein [Bradyrhizobium septentrionale]UGY24642.1 methyltransferase domain-containing protein [Bradyrhizobium septentrionale]
MTMDWLRTSWRDVEVDESDDLLEPVLDDPAEHACAVEFGQISGKLISPDSGLPLHFNGVDLSTNSGELFPIDNRLPVLLPQAARHFADRNIETLSIGSIKSAFDQYLYLCAVKNAGGELNTPFDDPWYKRHLFRSRVLLATARGLVLDIGCDSPDLSRRMFPPSCEYLGIEPSLGRSEQFRVVGMAEFLPFAEATFDCVSFLTSLDHVFDYHTAIAEAARVLKPGGKLYLATLIWTESAELYRDAIHFHHFRDYEIQGALRGFSIAHIKRYGWKGDRHRFGVYLEATKL